MPYIKKVRKSNHHCVWLPDNYPNRFADGSMWRCRKCKQVWELRNRYWVKVQPCGKGICALDDGHEGECCF